MQAVLERLNKQGNYANVTPLNKRELAEVFNNNADIVGITLGPDSSPVLIQYTDEELSNIGTAQDGCYATKDGYTVLNKIRHNNKYLQAIINTSFETTKHNNNTSGDGTTTSYVLFAKMYYHIYNNTYKKYVETRQPVGISRRLTDGQFSKLLRKTIKAFCKRIDELHRYPVSDYDKLIDIARISLNNDDDNLKPIKALLTKLKENRVMPSAVNISIADSGTTKTTISVSGGFEFSTKTYLRTQNDVSIENARFIVLDRNIETYDSTEGIIALMASTRDHFNETGEKFIVVTGNVIDSFMTHLESWYRNQETLYDDEFSGEGNYERHLFVVAYPETKGIPKSLYQEDMLIYFNSSMYNITEAEVAKAVENRTRIETSTRVDQLKKEMEPQAFAEWISDPNNIELIQKEIYHTYNALSTADKIRYIVFNDNYSKLPKVRIDDATNNFNTVIMKDEMDANKRNDQALVARIKQISEIKDDTASINEKEICYKRLSNLIQQYAIINIGAATDTERETLYSANLDATLAVNSASKEGLVSGMCIPTILTANEFSGSLDEHVKEKVKPNIDNILDLYEFNDDERVVLKDLAEDIKLAACFIFDSILNNADLNSEEIVDVYRTLWTTYEEAVMADRKFEPVGFDVLSYTWSDRIVSPYESEKSYIDAGLLTVIPFMTARLFLHPNEYMTSNAKDNNIVK